MWKLGTTAENRRHHHADPQGWADEIRASYPQQNGSCWDEHSPTPDRGRRPAARTLDVWTTACATSPPPPLSNQWDNEPLIDFESNPRLSEDDRADMQSLAEQGPRRRLDRYGNNG